MITIAELKEKWNSMTAYSGGYLLVSNDHPASFHIGYEGEFQKTFVVLNTGKLEGLVSSKAVHVENIELENGEYALKFLLRYASLDEIFIKLCWDLMDVSIDSEDPVATIVEQYRKWLRLLQQVKEGLMPKTTQKGLIGELLFLKELIASKGAKTALDSWSGPEGSDQDFNLADYWAEVKTTTIAGTSVMISSLQQLDRRDLGFLVVYHMDSTSSHGHQSISLDEAVRSVAVLLDSRLGIEFECKLARMGYQTKDAEKYNDSRFNCSDRDLYRIAADFPKLTKDVVPIGIIGAKYEINLPSIEPFRTREIG